MSINDDDRNVDVPVTPEEEAEIARLDREAESEAIRDDPFGYLEQIARSQAEDAEAEVLLEGMMADGNSYLRWLIDGKPETG
jgi:hypothetical protein